MSDRTVRVIISGSSAGAVKAFTETALASDAAGKAISGSTGKMSKAVESSTSTSGISFKSLGNSAFALVPIWGKVGIAAGVMVAGVVAGAIFLAVKFQDSTNKLAASAGISVAAAKAIGAAFLTTGGQTTFSAQQMLTAFTPVAGQLSIMNGRALTAGQSLAFMRAAMDLAEASGTGLTETTAALATVMQTFGIPVKGAAAATDILYNVSRATDTPISALGASLDKLKTKLGPLAPSLKDTGTLLLDLNEHGVIGGRGLLVVSSAMSTLLTNTTKNETAITKANLAFDAARVKWTQMSDSGKASAAQMNAQSAKAAVLFQKMQVLKEGVGGLGLTIYDSTGKFVGMQSVIAQLGPKLEGMTFQQRHAAEAALFGASSANVLDSTLMAGLPAWNAAALAAGKAGSAHTAAATATSSLSGSFDKVKAAMANAGVTLGQYFLPIGATLMKWLASAVQGFAYVLPGALKVIGIAFDVLGHIIGPAITFWTTLVKVWIAVISTVVGIIINVVKAVSGPILSIGGFFKTAFGGVASVVAAVFGGIVTAVKGAINGVIGVINFFIGLIDAIQVHVHIGPVGIDWNGLKIPKIPTLDTGGIVTRPTLALLAANSKPEAVIPIGSGQFAGGGGAGGDTYITMNVTSNDGVAVVNALVRYFRSNGPIPITVNRARSLGST